MMKCKKIHNKLIFFIEGDLPENEMAAVSAHLEVCSSCREFVEEMKKTLGIINLEKQVQVSPYFYTRVKARMEGQQESSPESTGLSLWERVLQPAFFTVLLLAGIYAGILTGRQRRNTFFCTL